MKKIKFLLILLISQYAFAGQVSLSCQMSGPATEGKRFQMIKEVLMVDLNSEGKNLSVNIDRAGQAFITLSNSSGKSINTSTDFEYSISEDYVLQGSQFHEAVKINRKTGSATFDKSSKVGGSVFDYHLTGICTKIEANKF